MVVSQVKAWRNFAGGDAELAASFEFETVKRKRKKKKKRKAFGN